jgi:vacuolar iron transporter family protein
VIADAVRPRQPKSWTPTRLFAQLARAIPMSERIPEHAEKHFTASENIRDVVIGMSDGLTVPFALAAGLTSAVSAGMSTRLIVVAGLAEIAAGAVAMGLGGFLAEKGNREHYESELARERREVRELEQFEIAETRAVFEEYGLSDDEIAPIVDALKRQPQKWVDFMMRFELGLEKPRGSRAWVSAATIAASYIAGGLIPLSPYMFVARPQSGLLVSVVFTLFALLIFGFLKGKLTSGKPVRSALQTCLIGGIAAAVAYVLARLVS